MALLSVERQEVIDRAFDPSYVAYEDGKPCGQLTVYEDGSGGWVLYDVTADEPGKGVRRALINEFFRTEAYPGDPFFAPVTEPETLDALRVLGMFDHATPQTPVVLTRSGDIDKLPIAQMLGDCGLNVIEVKIMAVPEMEENPYSVLVHGTIT